MPPVAMRLVKAPVPLTVLAKVRLPERLRTNSPLSVMTAEEGSAPTVPPLPTWRMPVAPMVVAPR